MPEKLTSTDAYAKLTSKHPRLNFPRWNWVNTSAKMEVECLTHGITMRSYKDLMRTKCGCSLCASAGVSAKKSTDDFLEDLEALYGEEIYSQYDYSKTEYKNAFTPVTIECVTHGEFTVLPNGLLSRKSKTPCAECNLEQKASKACDTKESFIQKANQTHANKYLYSDSIYLGSKEYINVLCPTHGTFQTKPNWHLSGRGCPSCSMSGRSAPEDEIIQILNAWEIKTVRNFKLENGREIDIYVPSHKLGIEYNGLYFHSEAVMGPEARLYHLNKTEQCETQKIELIHIFEDEWIDKQRIVLSRLQSRMGLSHPIPARKCRVVEVSNQDAAKFLESNHIQGACAGGSIRLGLELEGLLVALMVLGPVRFDGSESLEMLRFCNLAGTTVVAGFSRLLSHVRRLTILPIRSYSDRRGSVGKVYLKNGFNHVLTSEP